MEYFADGPNADFFTPALKNTTELIVPAISVYQAFKRVLQQRNGSAALEAVAVMQHGQIMELDTPLTLSAAKLSVELGLPMADSIILATARHCDATLWTEDATGDGSCRSPLSEPPRCNQGHSKDGIAQ